MYFFPKFCQVAVTIVLTITVIFKEHRSYTELLLLQGLYHLVVKTSGLGLKADFIISIISKAYWTLKFLLTYLSNVFFSYVSL